MLTFNYFRIAQRKFSLAAEYTTYATTSEDYQYREKKKLVSESLIFKGEFRAVLPKKNTQLDNRLL